jgi:hypothetical protein
MHGSWSIVHSYTSGQEIPRNFILVFTKDRNRTLSETILIISSHCISLIIIIIIINSTAAQSRALASLTGFVMILLCGLSAPRSTWF